MAIKIQITPRSEPWSQMCTRNALQMKEWLIRNTPIRVVEWRDWRRQIVSKAVEDGLEETHVQY